MKKFYKKEYLVLLFIVLVFLGLRLPAVHFPYHQDEYKWPLYSDESVYPPGSVPHPPLTEYIYRVLAPNLGYNNFRFMPLIFSIANLLLLYYLVRNLYGKKVAIVAGTFFAVSYYSILASLMIDVDGAVMPFFYLTSLIGYFKFRDSGWKDWKWGVVMLLGITGGFLVKVSGILPTIAIALDFALEKKVFEDKRRIFKYLFYGVCCAVGFVLLLLIIKFIFPFFNLEKALVYWKHFAVINGRGWTQTFIQLIKALLYLSPLFVLIPIIAIKDVWKGTRVFYLFIFVGLIFYILAFDFSLGALDRYLEFLIIPTLVISAVFLTSEKVDFSGVRKRYITIVAFILLGITLLQGISQYVPPLHPKTEWISRAISLKWNFLYPFFGGSGPTGFYISFTYIGFMWILGFILVGLYLFQNKNKTTFLIALVLLGLVYNFNFTQEYLLGTNNGSAPRQAMKAIEYIKSNPDIKKVLVYNDLGGYSIRQIGKYERRLYAVPGFEPTYEEVFKNFSGHLLYIDIPKVPKDTIYEKYIDSCLPVYQDKDKYITSIVYDCRK
ncbi:MAG: glycosyltransferase family 39 protein [Minisyncoccia bacterium]